MFGRGRLSHTARPIPHGLTRDEVVVIRLAFLGLCPSPLVVVKRRRRRERRARRHGGDVRGAVRYACSYIGTRYGDLHLALGDLVGVG